MATTSNVKPPKIRRLPFDFDDDGGSLVNPDMYMKIISPTAGDFSGTYSVIGATWNWAAIGWAACINTTSYISIPIPHFSGSGLTAVRINGANLEVDQAGDHDWTGYKMYVFIYYNDT